MRIVKKINNNVALALNQKQQEVFVVGKGIGFPPVPYDLDEGSPLIEKVFVSIEEQGFGKMFDQIPSEIIILTQRLIDDAQLVLKKDLHPRILLTLSDHIHYTLERFKENLELKSLIHWEIKHIYPNEYKAACDSVATINKVCDVDLSPSEAAFIAIHYVNAQLKAEATQRISLTDIISDVTALVKYQFQLDIERDQINYERFVTHLRLLVERQLADQNATVQNEYLYLQGKEKYPQEAKCVDLIAGLLSRSYQIECNNDEKLYLLLHIRRLTQRLTT
ncbi:MAG: PRD domain-containing protein [Erysipelotrichia bacterium]|nr:PRD domain-containing protein [Erysipelotrichia bacterium]